MKEFEYTVLNVPLKGFFQSKIDFEGLTNKLNELGKKGWEAINLSDTQMYQGAARVLIIILKREIIH